MVRTAHVQEEVSQMIHLEKSIVILIGIGNDEDHPQEAEIGENLLNNRLHLQFLDSYAACIFQFATVQAVERQTGSLDEDRLVLYDDNGRHHFGKSR